MKNPLLLAILLLTFTWAAHGQTHTQSLTFDDLGLGGGTTNSGTYNQNDTFGFDVYLTFDGYICGGLSFWLETQVLNNFSGSLSITGVTYGPTFPISIQRSPNPAPFNASVGASAGYQTENRDLGSINSPPSTTPGTYFVAHITLSIVGAMPGVYTLRSTTVSPHISEATSFDPGKGGTFSDNILPVEEYTITIVPEPATLGLLALGAVSLAIAFRAKKRISIT